MLCYTCPTCHTIFNAEVAFNKVIYMDGVKRVTLENGNDDCANCKKELDQITATAREKAREDLRSKKTTVTTKNS